MTDQERDSLQNRSERYAGQNYDMPEILSKKSSFVMKGKTNLILENAKRNVEPYHMN